MEKPTKSNDIFYKLQTKIKIHDDSVLFFIILKDSRYASSSCDNSIKIFNENTYKIDLIILEHIGYVCHLFQLKNEKLVSSSSDNTIKIFRLLKNSYNIEQILTKHSQPVKKTIELLNGYLASCSWDKTIKIWKKDKKNLYQKNQQFKESFEIHNIFEISDEKLVSVSIFRKEMVEKNKRMQFYIKGKGKFKRGKTISNIDICGFTSSIIKLNETNILIGGYKKIFMIDIINYSINKTYELDKPFFYQSLCLLSDGKIIVGAETDLVIFKIINNNFESIMEGKIQESYNDIAISSIREDLNKNNIIVALYNGEIKVLSKK